MSATLAECLALEAECPLADAVEMLHSRHLVSVKRALMEMTQRMIKYSDNGVTPADVLRWYEVSEPAVAWLLNQTQKTQPSKSSQNNGGIDPEFGQALELELATTTKENQ